MENKSKWRVNFPNQITRIHAGHFTYIKLLQGSVHLQITQNIKVYKSFGFEKAVKEELAK